MILYLNTPGLQNMIMNSKVLGITVNSFIVSWIRCSTHPLCPGRDGYTAAMFVLLGVWMRLCQVDFVGERVKTVY